MRQFFTGTFWRRLIEAWHSTPGGQDAGRMLESAVYSGHLYGIDSGNATQALFERERTSRTP